MDEKFFRRNDNLCLTFDGGCGMLFSVLQMESSVSEQGVVMMDKITVALMVVVALGVTGCSMLRDNGINEQYYNVAKALVLERVAEAAAEEGLDVSKDELSEWYDAIVTSPVLNELAEEVVENTSIQDRVAELIGENIGVLNASLPTVEPVTE